MKTIAIYPGNFQPAHKGHFQIYKQLRKMVGSDVFVALTSGEPTEHAPLNFSDKELIWVRHGVPASHIIKVGDWKHPREIFDKFAKGSTSVIFALNPKEIDELRPRRRKAGHVQETTEDAPVDPNKEVWVDANGQLNYYQPLQGNEGHTLPLDKHAYVLEVDDSQIDGKVWSTANIRQALGSKKYTPDQKKKLFFKIFGWFDIGLYNILSHKFGQADQVAAPDVSTGSQQLRAMVRECLREILEGSLDGGGTLGSDNNSSDMSSIFDKPDSNSNPAQDKAANLTSLVQQKKELEAKAKQNKQQRDSYDTTVKNYDRIQKKADRDALDATNQKISQASTAPTTSTTL